MTRQEDWLLLAYRLPRVPSTPRSAVWRKLRRFGVVQLGDGLVALPADPRTREQLEWIAEEVTDNGGEATIWLGRPASAQAAAVIAARMTEAIAADYSAVLAEAESLHTADEASQRRGVSRLRRELRRIQARDYFPTAARDAARQAVEDLAALTTIGTRR
jgi:ChrB-like protein